MSNVSNKVLGPIVHDKLRKMYILDLNDNQLAHIEYKSKGSNLIELYHSEVPETLRGQGYGKILVRQALDSIEKDGLKIKVTCSYIQSYMDKFASPNHKQLLHES